MRKIKTRVDIRASAGAVWEVLTAFDSFRDWNPFIVEAEGDLREGARLRVRIAPPGAKPMTFRPVVKRLVPERELVWLGRLGLPRIFDGEHRFTIEETDEGVRLTHAERFRGVLVPLMWGRFADATRRGFAEMNQALRERVEGRAA